MTSNTLNRVILSTESSATSGPIRISGNYPNVRNSARSMAKIENAVYAHIRAIRALGQTSVNTSEVAAALSLPVGQVNSVLSSLKRRGVKLL
jgi:hypothetical protein